METDGNSDRPILPRPEAPDREAEKTRLAEEARQKLEAEEKNAVPFNMPPGADDRKYICPACGKYVSLNDPVCTYCGAGRLVDAIPAYGSPPFLKSDPYPPDNFSPLPQMAPAYGSPSMRKNMTSDNKKNMTSDNKNRKIIFIVVGIVIGGIVLIIAAAVILFALGVIFAVSR